MSTSKRYKSVLLISAVVIAYILLGFYRDTFFKNLNSQADVLHHRSPAFELSAGTGFLKQFTTDGLMKLKWIMTCVFSLLFFFLGWITLKLFFGERKNRQLLLFAYLFVFSLSLLVYLSGKLFPSWEEQAFSLARNLVQALQSPLIIMILIPVILLMKKSQLNTGNSRSN